MGPTERGQRALRVVGIAGAVGALAIGLAVLAGWMLDVPRLRAPVPGLVAMKANTAIGFIALASAMLLARTPGRGGPAARALLAVGGAIGLLTLAEYAAGLDLGIDELLVADHPEVAVRHLGRMAPQSALALVLLAAAGAQLDRRERARLVDALLIVSFLVAVYGLLSYAFRQGEQPTLPAFTPMALHTATAFLLLAGAGMCARPWLLGARLLGRGPGAAVARRLLPVVLLLMPVLGFLRLEVDRAGLLGTGASVAVLVTACMGLLVAGVLATARALDRNETKLRDALAEAQEASRVKSQFLANMSHEIRTPLNGVIGMQTLLQCSGLDPEQRELNEVSLRSAEALLGVLNDILDFSKLEAGRVALEEADFRLGELLADAAGTFAGQAAGKGLELRTELDPALPDAARGDGARLRQVVANLVNNAVKFTDAGEVVLTARGQVEDDGVLALHVEVRDTGPGIAPEQLERLFDPFVQADATAARRHGGTGLGLAIARELAERMGGTLVARSEPGRGSAFCLDLPLRPAAAVPPPGPAPAEAAPPRPVGSGAGPLVLVAEDNDVNRRVAQRQLERLGCRVALAEDGAAAVAATARADFDLVLMDCQMPGVDGYEATRRIRAAEGPGARLPIVALTASAMEGDRERCLAAGMDDHLTKPTRPAELRRAVAEWSRRPLPAPVAS